MSLALLHTALVTAGAAAAGVLALAASPGQPARPQAARPAPVIAGLPPRSAAAATKPVAPGRDRPDAGLRARRAGG